MWSWDRMLPVLEPRYRNAPKASTTPGHVFGRCFFLFSLASSQFAYLSQIKPANASCVKLSSRFMKNDDTRIYLALIMTRAASRRDYLQLFTATLHQFSATCGIVLFETISTRIPRIVRNPGRLRSTRGRAPENRR